MTKRELIKRGIAAGMTLGFMALVRPNPVKVVNVSIAAVLIYEGLYWSVDYIWRMKVRSDRYIDLTRAVKAQREMREVELQKFKRRVG